MAYIKLMYHIVFSTKERRPFLHAPVMPQLCDYIGGIIRTQQGKLLAANGMPDHLHLAVLASQKTTIADFVRAIKSNSSKWVHAEFADLATFGWQDSYAAFSVSASVMPDVVGYIEQQPAHHQKLSFQDEFIKLLEKHGIEYDPRYIWA